MSELDQVFSAIADDPWTWLPALALGSAALFLLSRRAARFVLCLPGVSITPKASRLLAHLVRSRHRTLDELLGADGCDERWRSQRAAAFERLAHELGEAGEQSSQWAGRVRDKMSDLRFADANRVPFPFARLMRDRFNLASVAVASDGPLLRDLDGNWSLDVSGSYGVNVAGYDAYKRWIERGWERVKDLGAVLGPLHPVVADNVERLRRISGKDEVSFHVSGTEAVMAAVRLARFNTGRKRIVCFAGAYHGWWDGVQPGIGSERPIPDCWTLKDQSQAALRCIAHRANSIAAVLVNPVQGFHPNSPPPNDAVLLTSEVRQARDSVTEYGDWLRELRAVCARHRIALIFDEVYSGFRLAPGGAQEFFGVEADMVVYGKTVAGGAPIGVVCGEAGLMRRFDPKRPMRIAYVVGTFSAHPLAMGAMNEFLGWLERPATPALYRAANTRCRQWAKDANRALSKARLPVRIVNLATIWTIQFTSPSRYNWLLQYYLRAEGVNLSWVGTGRCLASLDFDETHYQTLTDRLRRAAMRMTEDKWWLTDEQQPNQSKTIKKRVAKDMAASLLPGAAFRAEVMQRKRDDHVASHSNRINQFLHLVSSSVFIFCYGLIFTDLVTAMWLGLAALFVRQAGHALIEPPCHDKEQLLLGFDTRSKTWVVLGYLLIPAYHLMVAPAFDTASLLAVSAAVARQWFLFTGLVVFGRVLLLWVRFDFRTAMIWFVKLVTDPITDIRAYYRSALPA